MRPPNCMLQCFLMMVELKLVTSSNGGAKSKTKSRNGGKIKYHKCSSSSPGSKVCHAISKLIKAERVVLVFVCVRVV